MNRLSRETSPYLLQHAHNPVDWYPWGDEALQRARAEDKPILVSIGYSACHWCHVMERESFENPQVAALMNEHFINIKIDREERPDIDQIYMDAVVVMTGQGGWPLNCFLLPDGRPFYGGTYFPPLPAHGRNDWTSVLRAIAKAFAEQRLDLERQANALTYHIFAQDKNVFQIEPDAVDNWQNVIELSNYEQWAKNFDRIDGGFGNAPKFPAAMALQYLLEYAYHTDQADAAQHALFSIDALCNGGIYDHLGGGFARYTVDKTWHVPHFEKMLYDNALLVGLLSDAYKILTANATHLGTAGTDDELTEQRTRLYADTLHQTLDWVARDMTSPEGGFYAAYDADSEGEEGKFYIWHKREIDRLLQDDAAIFCAFYGISEDGSWEESKNILSRRYTEAALSDKIGYDTDELYRLLAQCRRKLFLQREKRPKPLLDDKMILGWNAMMNTAYTKAYRATQKNTYLAAAERNMQFLLSQFRHPHNGGLYHNYTNGKAANYALLDDYALLIESLLSLYTATFNPTYIEQATQYTDYVLRYFDAPNAPLFFYTHADQSDLIGRKTEYYDNATPSGNSTMAHNLLQLYRLTHHAPYEQRALRLLRAMQPAATRYTNSFGRWASALLSLSCPPPEINVVGKQALSLAQSINALFIPNATITANAAPNEQNPQHYDEQETLIYVCQNQQCALPTANFVDFIKLLTK